MIDFTREMSPVISMSTTEIFVLNTDSLTLLSLTTHLNAILLFITFCDPDKSVSRVWIPFLLAVVDLAGVLISLILSHSTPNEDNPKFSVLFFCQIFFLALDYLAFLLNWMILKRVNQTIREFTSNPPVTICSTSRLKQLPYGNLVYTNISCVDKRNVSYYHGLSLLVTLIMISFFPFSVNFVPLPLIYHAVMRNTLLRTIFYCLDGVVILVRYRFPRKLKKPARYVMHV